jgi:hypothetical protein
MRGIGTIFRMAARRRGIGRMAHAAANCEGSGHFFGMAACRARDRSNGGPPVDIGRIQ